MFEHFFTRNGHVGSRVYFEDPQLRAGYLVYYLPVNLAKVQVLLDELQPVLPVAPDQDFRVLDLGGGPGTGALGVLDWCLSKYARPPSTLRMIAVDRSPDVLRVSAEIWKAYSEQQRDQSIPPLNTVECNLERSLPSAIRDGGGVNGYQLIIVQNLLSELFVGSMDPVGQRTALVGELLDQSGDGQSDPQMNGVLFGHIDLLANHLRAAKPQALRALNCQWRSRPGAGQPFAAGTPGARISTLCFQHIRSRYWLRHSIDLDDRQILEFVLRVSRAQGADGDDLARPVGWLVLHPG